MAGLYVKFGSVHRQPLDAVARWMRFSDEAERRYDKEISYVWLAHDNSEHYSPATDPHTGVQVITAGRLVWPAGDWQRAQQLPYDGGLACRVMLDRYLQHGAAGVAPFNGAATVLISDPRLHRLHLWTDQFGYHPAFVYSKNSREPTVFTTFPDAIRHDPAIDTAADEVSMVEFLRAWRATPPNTYYKYLKHADPATHWTWDLTTGGVTREVYWKPFQGAFFRSSREAAEALSVALQAAIRERTAAAKKVTLFVSGGADSRVMLFGADDPNKITGINLYETEPTHESEISRALCERVGAKYVGHTRDNDYYPRLLPDIVRWSGAMWSAEDSHYLGVNRLVRQTGADLVMTACTTDWVFKGYGLERTNQQFLGKDLPLKRFLTSRVDGFLPNHPRESPEAFRDAVDNRLSHWFTDCPRELRDDLDFLRVEDRRIRPTCYTVSVSGQIMYRTYPYDTFLADSRVADCYGRIPAWMKLNGEVWGLAASLVCRGADDIVDANNGWSVDASAVRKLFVFGKGWVSRRWRRLTARNAHQLSNDHPPCYASWPDLGWYATNSATIDRLWGEARSETREQLTRLWGADPWRTPRSEWSQTSLDFFRILTLMQYLTSLHRTLQPAPHERATILTVGNDATLPSELS